MKSLISTAIGLALLSASTVTWASSPQRFPYQSCFEVAAQMHHVPLDLLLAVAATESNWDADARSHANAHGIMQIQWPGTARHLGVKRIGELYNPCYNISLGARYLNELITQFSTSTEQALAAYNYGPSRIRATDQLPAGARAYAAKVMKHQRRINAGLIPKALKPYSQRTLVTFNSKSRATRLSKQLARMIEGATITVNETERARHYAVVLLVGKGGLTAGDHATLHSMGWEL